MKCRNAEIDEIVIESLYRGVKYLAQKHCGVSLTYVLNTCLHAGVKVFDCEHVWFRATSKYRNHSKEPGFLCVIYHERTAKEKVSKETRAPDRKAPAVSWRDFVR